MYVNQIINALMWNTLYFITMLKLTIFKYVNFVLPYLKVFQQEKTSSWKLTCYDPAMSSVFTSSNLLDKTLHEKIQTLKKNDMCSTIVLKSPDNVHKIWTPNNIDTFSHTHNKLVHFKNAFPSISLTHNGTCHEIDLNCPNFILYAHGNCIDKYLLYYYLVVLMNAKNVKSIHCFEYELELLDENINLHHLTHDDHIEILDNGEYKVHLVDPKKK